MQRRGESGYTSNIQTDSTLAAKVRFGSEPKYADRFFELKKDAIIFGTGGDNVDTYPIASIERTRDEEGLLYNIHYLNRHRQRYTFSIYYDPTNHGVIRFKNQKHFTWTKEKR